MKMVHFEIFDYSFKDEFVFGVDLKALKNAVKLKRADPISILIRRNTPTSIGSLSVIDMPLRSTINEIKVQNVDVDINVEYSHVYTVAGKTFDRIRMINVFTDRKEIISGTIRVSTYKNKITFTGCSSEIVFGEDDADKKVLYYDEYNVEEIILIAKLAKSFNVIIKSEKDMPLCIELKDSSIKIEIFLKATLKSYK
jgi:hypothetical protein